MKAVLVFLALSGVLLAGTLKGRIVYKGKAPEVKVVEVKTDALICGEKVEVNPLERSADGGVKKTAG